MCKVAWQKRSKEYVEKETGETGTAVESPEPSLLPLTFIKQKFPLKLLDFYEHRYFDHKYH